MSADAVPAEVLVGRIGRAHGVRGDVAVDPRTDEPDRRFADDAVLRTTARTDGTPAPAPSLRVESTRWHSGRLLVRFAGVGDRSAAEALRGTGLVVDLDPTESPADPEEFYDHQLVGLRVRTDGGEEVGTVTAVVHGSAQDLLALDVEGRTVLVPFVAALVPEVDVAAGHLVVADRPGLLREAPTEEG